MPGSNGEKYMVLSIFKQKYKFFDLAAMQYLI